MSSPYLNAITMRLLHTLILLCAILPSQAQLRFRSLPPNSGLSSNMINAISQDHQGFMYFGTATGLNRFDGYNVNIIPIAVGDSLVSDNYVRGLAPGAGKKMIVQTNAAFYIFDPANESFTDVKYGILGKAGLQRSPAVFIADDAGNYWTYVRGEGMLRISPNGKIARIDDPVGAFAKHDITAILPITADHMVASNNHGQLILVDTHSLRVVRVIDRPGQMDPSHIKYRMFVDKDLNVWMYAEPGIWIYDTRRNLWSTNFRGVEFSSLPIIRVVSQDHDGNVWVGFDHDGMMMIDNTGATHMAQNHPGDHRSLSSNSITALFTDRTGTTWIGTRKSGIMTYNPDLYKFEFALFPDVDYIIEDPTAPDASVIWIGTDANGLIRWNRRTGQQQLYCDGFQNGSNVAAVVCMIFGRDGSLWAGTYSGGLKRLRDGVVTTYRISDGLSANSIWSILELPNGNLLLGTLGGGLQIFDVNSRTFRTFNASNSGLGSNYVSSMVPLPDGTVYIGTSAGLSLYDPAEDTITNRMGTNDGTQQFASSNINQVFIDSRGLIWLATYSGIEVYDPKADRIYHVEYPGDNSHEFILALAEDDAARMWVSIGKRLLNITVRALPDSSRTFESRVYNDRDGLQDCDLNQRSMAVLSTGEVMVGGLHGVNIFRPSVISNRHVVPNVFFTDLSLSHRPVRPGTEAGNDMMHGLSVNFTDKIVIPADRTEFTVSFATDDYVNPGKTRFSYRLDGHSSSWTELPMGVNSVSYNNLSPGSYRLRVKAISESGIESTHEASINILVKPPFYLSTWAKILYSILFAAIILLVFYLIKRHERMKMLRRQKEESARKQDELNQMKFRFFTNISHELRTPLTLITAPLDSILKRDLDPTTRRQVTLIKDNANRLLNLVNQLLDLRKSEMSGLSLNVSSGDIVHFSRSVFEAFVPLAEKRGIKYTFASDHDTLPMNFDEDKIGKLLMNLLSNAFKFTDDGGRISLSLSRLDDNAIFKVADNGRGISDADKAHIFERFFQANDSVGNGQAGTGIGLSLVAEYAALHGGSASVADNDGGGTVFTVTIPVSTHDTPSGASGPEHGHAIFTAHDTDQQDMRPRILVVDDSADMLEFLSSELSDTYLVDTAANGAEALDKLHRFKPSIIISDVMMPVMDGIEFCRKVKSDPDFASTPLILLTAKHDVSSKIEGLTLGADEYMTKPFNIDVLRLRVGSLIQLTLKGFRRPLIEPEPKQLSITSVDEQLIEKAVTYVEENMARTELSVEEMATFLGMSRVHLYKRLKHITGKSPIEFIRVLRLKRAAQLLRESQLNVSEIAYRIGFNNPKYFSKYFREEFGISPSEYQSREGV